MGRGGPQAGQPAIMGRGGPKPAQPAPNGGGAPAVLVVGAGPVGLTAATFLAHFGTPVLIIDPNAAATTLSKALVIWRRTLQTLDPVLPHEELLKRGAPLRSLRLGDSGRMFSPVPVQDAPGPADLGTGAGAPRGLPPGLLLTQAALEEALETNLRERYATRVARSTRLLSFRPDPAGAPGGVLATLSDAAGATREVAVPFLIAADGAHSAVRHGLKIPFPGVTLPMRWRFFDVRYEAVPGINPRPARAASDRVIEEDGMMVMTTAAGTVGLVPLAGRPGVARLIWNHLAGKEAAAAALAGTTPPPPTLDELQALLMEHTLLDVRLAEVLWFSEFAINERQAESYVHQDGRVLLAGDAAHVHSPAGGQGMNLGVQDAANLAWKVALAAAGEAAAQSALLSSYQEERWPLGAAVIKISGRLLRANTMRHPFLRGLRRLALSAALRLPSVRRTMVSIFAEDGVSYPDSPLTGPGPAPARRPSARAASAQARASWGRCRPGRAFSDVHVAVSGAARPATDLLRGPPGSFGTLVLLMPRTGRVGAAAGAGAGADDPAWPEKWGARPLHVARVSLLPEAPGGAGTESDAADSAKDDVAADADDKWGLLAASLGLARRRRHGGAVGVLVRPDGYVATVGGPDAVNGWLAKHVAAAAAAPAAAPAK